MKVRKWQSVLLVLLLLASLVGCSGGSVATDSMDRYNGNFQKGEMEVIYDSAVMETTSPSASESGTGESTATTARKWIITINMRAETEDLDALLGNLNSRITELDGYVEASNVYNGSAYSGSTRYRSASLTIRVPAQSVDRFTEQVSQASNVISQTKNMDDITLSYVSVESRMKALQVEEERLLALLAQAENMSDLLEIESRLTEVRYELERVTSQLRVYDNQVDFATIYLEISEVREYTVVEEQTVWQRIGNGFVASLKGIGNFLVELFVFLVANLPYLILIGAVVWLIVFLCRRAAKKRREKYQVTRPPYYPPAPDQNKPQ